MPAILAFGRGRRLRRDVRLGVNDSASMAHPPSQHRPQRASYLYQQKRWPILLLCGCLAVFTGTILFLFGVVGFSEYSQETTRNWICLTLGLILCAGGMALLLMGRRQASDPAPRSSSPYRRRAQRRRRRPDVHPDDRPMSSVVWSTPPNIMDHPYPPPPAYMEAVTNVTYSAQSPRSTVFPVALPTLAPPPVGPESPPPYEETERRRPRARSTEV